MKRSRPFLTVIGFAIILGGFAGAIVLTFAAFNASGISYNDYALAIGMDKVDMSLAVWGYSPLAIIACMATILSGFVLVRTSVR